MRGIVRLANGASFLLDHVRCWDRSLESPGSMRVHLADGVKFNVHRHDIPSPVQVEQLFVEQFGPVFGATGIGPSATLRCHECGGPHAAGDTTPCSCPCHRTATSPERTQP